LLGFLVNNNTPHPTTFLEVRILKDLTFP